MYFTEQRSTMGLQWSSISLSLRTAITNSHQLGIRVYLNVNFVHSEENLNSHCLDDDYVKHDQKTRHAKGKNISTSKLFALEKNSTKNAQTA